MNYRADQALRFRQKILGIRHELMELLRFSHAFSLFCWF